MLVSLDIIFIDSDDLLLRLLLLSCSAELGGTHLTDFIERWRSNRRVEVITRRRWGNQRVCQTLGFVVRCSNDDDETCQQGDRRVAPLRRMLLEQQLTSLQRKNDCDWFSAVENSRHGLARSWCKFVVACWRSWSRRSCCWWLMMMIMTLGCDCCNFMPALPLLEGHSCVAWSSCIHTLDPMDAHLVWWKNPDLQILKNQISVSASVRQKTR